MPDETLSDINYQPKTEGFSYINPKKQNGKKPNIFITLLFGIIGFLILFSIFLGLLNYFKVISLPSVTPFTILLPQKTPPPKPIYNSQTNNWTLEGTLYGYDNYILKVKFYNQIINFQFNPSESSYFISSNSSKNVENTQILGIFSDLETKENIGRKVNVQYRTENKINILEIITLYK